MRVHEVYTVMIMVSILFGVFFLRLEMRDFYLQALKKNNMYI
jgi:hypothetical protein